MLTAEEAKAHGEEGLGRVLYFTGNMPFSDVSAVTSSHSLFYRKLTFEKLAGEWDAAVRTLSKHRWKFSKVSDIVIFYEKRALTFENFSQRQKRQCRALLRARENAAERVTVAA